MIKKKIDSYVLCKWGKRAKMAVYQILLILTEWQEGVVVRRGIAEGAFILAWCKTGLGLFVPGVVGGLHGEFAHPVHQCLGDPETARSQAPRVVLRIFVYQVH